ncbi:phosphatidate cytidylyltransferase [Rhodospirillaceae bacterium KN72]|uniref:Phosphatidate cytidylyltransferase n=1 Tax=Pacificispira spongiicola TaxID=2729598 RepID=A0A7Y0HEY5_9PROT|nr:phosphatidate cytidylyltransferase [Pacificispira spongiicola]NMM44033.1 phosphatidate cytidylyltransferase [Pacificispira spongiicola]
MTGGASKTSQQTLPTDLKVRAVSGAVMILIAAVELYIGGSFFTAFVALLAGGMVWEALNLTKAVGIWRRAIAIATSVLSLLILMPALPDFGGVGGGGPVWLSLLLIGACLLIAWSAASAKKAFPWGIVATASVCGGCLVIVLSELRSDLYHVPPLILLVPAVIGTDIGAYFTGRRLGGPKLAPRISPNKTWSGAIGGVVSAVILGALTAWLLRNELDAPGLLPLLPVLAGLSICAQIGDLVESWLKRRAGKKDSSHLIPGHGGLLDRFDGFLGASLMGLGPWLLLQEFGV